MQRKYHFDKHAVVSTSVNATAQFSLVPLISQQELLIQTDKEEKCIVLLEGNCEIKTTTGVIEVRRESVFSEKPTALYVSNKDSVHIRAKKDSYFAVCSAKADSHFPTKIIFPQDLNARSVGKGNYARTVIDICIAGTNSAACNVGETFQEGGNWSSIYPTDNQNYFFSDRELNAEEAYYYKFNPSKGFGLQWIYNKESNIDEAFSVVEDDIIITPFAHHPVVTAPQFAMYYLWFYGN